MKDGGRHGAGSPFRSTEHKENILAGSSSRQGWGGKRLQTHETLRLAFVVRSIVL
jgi:hypothetical protein